MPLVVPRDHRRALDEFLRRSPDRRPVLAERRDQLGGTGYESRPVAGHRGALAQGLEDGDMRAVARLEDGVRRLVEPKLRVGLVGGQQEVVLGGERRQPLEEGKRRDRSGRIVGVVDPEQSRPLPGLIADRVEIREEAVLLQQRQLLDIRAGKEGAPVVDGVARLRREDKRLGAVPVDDDLRKVEDRLLAAVGRNHLCLRVDLDAETALAPARDRFPQLRQALRERIARERLDALGERPADQRIRLLPWVALAEVDQFGSRRSEPAFGLLEADEGISARRGEHRRKLHG